VAEHPLARLGRVAGGVVLMPGRLGHQVLGQLLLSGSTDVAIAAASVAVAAATRQRDVVVQVAISTIVPALAVRSLLQKQEERLKLREQLLRAQAQHVGEAARGQLDKAGRQVIALETERRSLQAETRRLQAEKAKLSADLQHSELLRRRRGRRRRS
jgi:hypothetical protein